MKIKAEGRSVASKAVWWSVKFLTEKHIGDYNDFALGLQGAPFDNTFVKKDYIVIFGTTQVVLEL